ncbi:uncharacterized protein BXIN_3088 [Babesia sp. Xinjiang]|uniref:uncharacterized protein n=1 Tax=Babesia sp. Xinjiang TaxID=462227 RepID=UPI000A231B6B|nr:uncharacterized protein BXIN_3088 [Babesia sp. Xinjiang]ORM39552.1 hypothetical protein BXIN_3088 [Babesia sp. Xinjiang]
MSGLPRTDYKTINTSHAPQGSEPTKFKTGHTPMFLPKQALLAVVTVLLLCPLGADTRDTNRHNGVAYTALRPFLRKPKITKRTSREEKKRRSEFHKQLHKELRLKYWERLDPAVNTVIQYKPELEKPIDPKRSFVVQEVIPELVKLESQQVNCTLTAEQSEAFDRRAGLQLICDIKAIFSTIADTINNDERYNDFKLMATQDQLPKQQSDVSYIMYLVKAREEPKPSRECLEYCEHLAELADQQPIKFLAHSLYIIKDWHLARRNFLTLLRSHLRLVRSFKCASFDNDCDTFQKTLNKTAREWSRGEKDTFINELRVAQEMAQKSLTSAIIYPYKASHSVAQLCEVTET